MWILTGTVLLLALPVLMNNFIIFGFEKKQLYLVYGSLMIISECIDSQLKNLAVGIANRH